jgi:UPF0716 protein FxsA|nr:FxsA family protein [Laceyella tengchongensis]
MRYVFWLILGLIIVVPAIELWGMITVGQWIGPWPTVFLVIATGVLGSYLARREGWQTYRLAQLQLQKGELPGEALLDGACILAGAVLLITPGFFSDIAGFVLVFPYTRTFVKIFLKKWIQKKLARGDWHIRRW